MLTAGHHEEASSEDTTARQRSLRRFFSTSRSHDRLLRPLVLMLCLGLLLGLTLAPGAWSLPRQSPEGPEGPPDDTPPPDPLTPYPPQGLAAITRAATSIALRWYDQASNEQGYTVWRSDPGRPGVWVQLATLSPLAGQGSAMYYTDTGLQPDTAYCYLVTVFNASGSGASPQSCAYTRDGRNYAVWRAQLVLHTANRVDANTDDSIFVRLNGDAFAAPIGNQTWLDYGRNDFERGDTFTYDLNLDTIDDLSDITHIVLGKDGDDGWCLADFALQVNGQTVFSQDFSSLPAGCLWLDTEAGTSPQFVVSHAMLRAHPAWAAYNHTAAQFLLAVQGIPNAELVSRLEAITGDTIHGTQLYWGHLYGPAVEVTRGCPASVEPCTTVHVDLDLAADVTGPDPEVDVDFDLTFTCANHELSITTSNVVITADSAWYWEIASLGLINLVDSKVEDRVRASWHAIAKTLSVGADCRITVNDHGDISIAAVTPATSGGGSHLGGSITGTLSRAPLAQPSLLRR